MADSTETAAAAFLADMGGSAPKAGKASAGNNDGPTESMFGDNDEMEDDDGSDPGNSEELEEEEEGEGDEELPDGDEGDEDADEDGEDEGDDDEADEGADDKGASGSLNLDQTVALTIDGNQVEVPLREALSGYIRSETFHQRLNILNEAKSEIIREQGETAQARQKYIEGVEELQRTLTDVMPREPTQAEWDAMYAADPENARKQEIAWRNYKQQRADLSAAAEKAKADQAAEQTKHLVNWVQAERFKVMRAVPEWNDEQTRVKEMSSMKRTALSVGYSEDEVNTLYDSRAIMVLRKAAAYDRMMAKKPKPGKTVVRQPQASGSGKPVEGKTGQKDRGRAMDQLRKTGSMEAATSVFGNILSADAARRRKR